jgi:glucose-6-phosphate 1-dehydrogenase
VLNNLSILCVGIQTESYDKYFKPITSQGNYISDVSKSHKDYVNIISDSLTNICDQKITFFSTTDHVFQDVSKSLKMKIE